jgi:hypothetical protein
MQATQSGFGLVGIIVIAALLGGAYTLKDEQGVSYLERGYSMARYYFVDRNQEALEGAHNAKALVDKQQAELQKAVNE